MARKNSESSVEYETGRYANFKLTAVVCLYNKNKIITVI